RLVRPEPNEHLTPRRNGVDLIAVRDERPDSAAQLPVARESTFDEDSVSARERAGRSGDPMVSATRDARSHELAHVGTAVIAAAPFYRALVIDAEQKPRPGPS